MTTREVRRTGRRIVFVGWPTVPRCVVTPPGAQRIKTALVFKSGRAAAAAFAAMFEAGAHGVDGLPDSCEWLDK